MIVKDNIQIGKGNAYKEIQKQSNFKFFEIFKIVENLFLFHSPSLLIHSTFTKSNLTDWRGLSEFHRKNIDDHKSCKINEQRFFLVKKVNFCFQKILLLLK